MDIYKRIQAISSFADRRKALKDLSDVDKKAYKRYQTNLRQKKFMSDAQNRDRVYAEKREYKRECRKNNPEKVREIVKGYVQRFRERRKIKIEAQHIASRIIDDIIQNAFLTIHKKPKK